MTDITSYMSINDIEEATQGNLYLQKLKDHII